MKIIGLCGGSGSGKGIVGSVFAKKQIPFIDNDKVYRELTSADSECLSALRDEFGSEIILPDGSLNRKRLAEIVFASENSSFALEKLNKISHKYILDETRKRLRKFCLDGYKAAIVDAPVLFESGFDSECDLVIAVIADKDKRIARVMERDGISYTAALQRIDSQMSDEDLISRCDYIIRNDSDLDSLEEKVDLCLKVILYN